MTATVTTIDTLAANFAAMKALLARWSETGDENLFLEAHDYGRAILDATPATAADANLRAFTGLLLAFGVSRAAPMELDIEPDSDAYNDDILAHLIAALETDCAAHL